MRDGADKVVEREGCVGRVGGEVEDDVVGGEVWEMALWVDVLRVSSEFSTVNTGKRERLKLHVKIRVELGLDRHGLQRRWWMCK